MTELSAPPEPASDPKLTRAEIRKQRKRGGSKNMEAARSTDKSPTGTDVGTAPRRWRVPAVVGLCVVVLLAGAAGWTIARLSRTAPAAAVEPDLMQAIRATGTAPALPWPTAGQAAVSIPAVGFSAQSGPEKPVPVASLTKIMTGYIVLHDHPLPPLPTTPGAPMPADVNGPAITITAADVSIFEADAGSDQSNIEVHVGEVLSERQLVQGTLIRSANNLATALALWDAGSLPAFVAKMNATAQRLGMSNTHFVDASGFDPSSVSTAGDILKVASVAMTEPGFVDSVDQKTVDLPTVGVLNSYTPLLGVDGTVGVKSGFTSAAGGCDVLALVRQVNGMPVVVLAASTGQMQYAAIADAGLIALNVAMAASRGIVPVVAVTSGQQVGSVSDGHTTVPITAQRSVTVVAWPSQMVTMRLSPAGIVRPGAPAGSSVGAVVVTAGTQSVTDPVGTADRLPALTLAQRLF